MKHRTTRLSRYDRLTAVMAAGAAVVAMLIASPDAKADPDNGVRCQTDIWGFLGSQRRTICDSPKRANGDWTRARVVWTPAHQVPFTCSYGRYFSSCSGGYFVNESVQSKEVYVVNDGNVLADEPECLAAGGRTT